MLFPTELLRVTQVEATHDGAHMALSLHLAPFELTLEGETETWTTRAEFTLIELPATAADLAGRTFDFPANPNGNYIDGSIYLYHAHHPVDATRLSFGEITDQGLPLQMTTRMVLSFEGLPGYDDTDWTVDVLLPLSALS